jgi:hypothetical protein
MRQHRSIKVLIAWIAVLGALVSAAAGQTPRTGTPAANSAQLSDKDVAALQDQLLQLLRVTPTLAEVVEHDPSLLSDAEYVSRTNPQLERFLQAHPEIASNPDFYLFNNLHGEGQQASDLLERKLWPNLSQQQPQPGEAVMRELISDGIPFLVFLCMLAAVLWVTHVLLENRRWNRIFKLQNDVHSKLIERFGTSQEVLTYMGTEAGKKFLEATPIAVGIERSQPIPSPVARILTPLQIGVVMCLLGIGLISTRHFVPGGDAPLLVLGTVVLMPGLGFIISAGITWVLARHLGLMPGRGEQS